MSVLCDDMGVSRCDIKMQWCTLDSRRRWAALEGSEAAGECSLELRGEEDPQLCDDASGNELVGGHVESWVPHLDAYGEQSGMNSFIIKLVMQQHHHSNCNLQLKLLLKLASISNPSLCAVVLAKLCPVIRIHVCMKFLHKELLQFINPAGAFKPDYRSEATSQ